MSEKMKIKTGPAGNSESFYAAGFTRTEDTFLWQKENFGLNAFEVPFGRGISMSHETAVKIGQEASLNGVSLSAHAPYYINLANPDPEQTEKSASYILNAARLLRQMGGERLVVHVGTPKYLGREEAMRLCQERLKWIRNRLEEEGLSGIRLCLETMGRPSVLGSLEEILKLVLLHDSFLPCLDFAHLHAISQGGLTSAMDFATALDQVEAALGISRARQMHMHFSKIEYGKKGEVRHRTFVEEGYGPDFALLAPLLTQRGYEGTLICESRGTMAEDAAQMRQSLLAAAAKN